MSTRPRCRARPSIEAPSAGSTISGNRVTMSIFIWVAVGAPAPGRLTQARLASGCGSHYGPALGALHDPEVLPGARLDPREPTDVAAVFGRHPSAFELPGIEAAGPGRQRLRGRHRDQSPDEGPRRLR